MRRIFQGFFIFSAICSTIAAAQDWLPKGTVVLYINQMEDSLLPDANFELKATITAEQFETIVKKRGLTLHTEKRKYSDDKRWLSWGNTSDPFNTSKIENKSPKDWDPSPSLENTYVKQSGHSWEFAKYENGFLYFCQVSH